VLQSETVVDDCLIHVDLVRAIGVSDGDVVDEGAGIGARQHERKLADDAVRDLLGPLDQAVREDRQRGDIPVLHQFLRVLGAGRLVEEAVGVDALVAMLEDGVTQDVLRGTCGRAARPAGPARCPGLERAVEDCASVRAPLVVLRGPSAEIGLHCHSVVRMHQAVLRRRVTEVQSGICSHFDCSFRLLGSSALLERS
jgi:hypothetical protein